MLIATLALCAFVFSVLALAAAFYSAVKVGAFEKSTHQIIQVNQPDPFAAEPRPVTEVLDVPLSVREQMPQPVEPPKTVQEYIRRQSAMASEDEYEANW